MLAVNFLSVLGLMGLAASSGQTSGCRHSSQKFFHKTLTMMFVFRLGTGRKRCSTLEDLSSVIEFDSFEQYGRREKARIFCMEEEPTEADFAKVAIVAEKNYLLIISYDVSIVITYQVGVKTGSR